MLYSLLYPLHHDYGFLNIFRYTSFRMIMAALTALVFALWLFPAVIQRLTAIGTQPIRDDGVAHHIETKSKTPTAGGSLIMGAVIVSTLLWGDLQNHYVLVLLSVMTLFALIGWYDDWRKMKYQDTKGLSGKIRLLAEFLVAFIAIYWLTESGMTTRIDLPFVSSWQPDLGVIGAVLFGGFVVVGTANACNLTDGLDGLAIGPVLISAATLLALAYVAGTPLGIVTDWGSAGAPSGVGDPAQAVVLADYLKILRVPGLEETAVVAAALLGAGMSFLWFNAHPASVFMGDTGSLGLGGALGMLAVMTRKELFSAVLHGLFLFNALSVIIQVFWYKRTGKRVFRMAPFHHHLELGGWAETKVVIRWWLLSLVLALAAVALLKIR
jgi:phospho-N-acetylmuramoyl-pentapeptide-transferase